MGACHKSVVELRDIGVYISERENNAIQNALFVAASQYERDSETVANAGNYDLANQFIRQAHEAMDLIELFEEAG